MAKQKESTITLEVIKAESIIKAIDLGNYNIKTDKENIFTSTFSTLDETETEGTETNLLEYDGVRLSMAAPAYFDNEFNKSKKNYLPNLFWALHKDDIPAVANIKLVLGTPCENTGIVESFKEDLEGKTFTFIAEKKQYDVTFEKVAIVSEGLSSFYMLPVAERKKDIILYDIGGRTTNIFGFRNGKVVFKTQVNRGMIDTYDDIKVQYNKSGNNINSEDVKRYIEKGFIPKEIVTKNHNALLEHLKNQTKKKCDIKDFDEWYTGGGSKEMEETIGEEKNFMAKSIFTNVLGEKRIAEIKWSE